MRGPPECLLFGFPFERHFDHFGHRPWHQGPWPHHRPFSGGPRGHSPDRREPGKFNPWHHHGYGGSHHVHRGPHGCSPEKHGPHHHGFRGHSPSHWPRHFGPRFYCNDPRHHGPHHHGSRGHSCDHHGQGPAHQANDSDRHRPCGTHRPGPYDRPGKTGKCPPPFCMACCFDDNCRRDCPKEKPCCPINKDKNSDDDSANDNERNPNCCRNEGKRKNKPCRPKNKDGNENENETVLIQRIVVEKAPRCYSV